MLPPFFLQRLLQISLLLTSKKHPVCQLPSFLVYQGKLGHTLVFFFLFSYNEYPLNHEFIIISSVKGPLFLSLSSVLSILALFMAIISYLNFHSIFLSHPLAISFWIVLKNWIMSLPCVNIFTIPRNINICLLYSLSHSSDEGHQMHFPSDTMLVFEARSPFPQSILHLREELLPIRLHSALMSTWL